MKSALEGVFLDGSNFEKLKLVTGSKNYDTLLILINLRGFNGV